MDTLLQSGDVPHPGHYIREELAAREWSPRDLAAGAGMPEREVRLILAGKRDISPETAQALATAFDVSPEFFANLQRFYDLALKSGRKN